MHELDASHQISASIIDAIRLLNELLPHPRSRSEQRRLQHLRMSGDVLQKLLLRSLSIRLRERTECLCLAVVQYAAFLLWAGGDGGVVCGGCVVEMWSRVWCVVYRCEAEGFATCLAPSE
eukprot:scaffold14440_cov143-Isochrysis_galbana.AAC.3